MFGQRHLQKKYGFTEKEKKSKDRKT